MFKILASLVAVFSLVSCQKTKEISPELEEYEQKKIELESLQAELNDLHIRVAAAKTKGPKNPVEGLRTKFQEKDGELKKLNAEYEKLKASEEEIKTKLKDYKEKYLLDQ